MPGNDTYTKLLMHFEKETFQDYSPAANTIVSQTNVIRSSTYKKFGKYGSYFDGTGLITVESSTDFAFGGDDFTIDFWYKPMGRNGDYTCILHNYTSSWVPNCWNISDRPLITGKIGCSWYHMGATWDYGLRSTTDIQENTWYHVAVVRHGTDMLLFLNGTLECTVDVGTDIADDGSSQVVYMGGNSNGKLIAGLDEVRISKGIARWTEDFIPEVNFYSNIYSSGILSETATMIMIDLATLEIENTNILQPGNYTLPALEAGEKLIVAMAADGQAIAYGRVNFT